MWGSWKRQQSWEKIIAAPAAPQPGFIYCGIHKLQMLLLWRNLQQHKNTTSSPPSIWDSVEFPKSPYGFVLFLPKMLMEPRVLSLAPQEGGEKSKKSGAAKQQMDKSQREWPIVVGCLPENSSEFQNKIKQKAPTKPNQNIPLRCQKLSLLSRHKRKLYL